MLFCCMVITTIDTTIIDTTIRDITIIDIVTIGQQGNSVVMLSAYESALLFRCGFVA